MNCFHALLLVVTSAPLNDGRWAGPGRDWLAVVSPCTASFHRQANNSSVTSALR